MELWRRPFLLFCLASGITLVFYASTSPLVVVRAVDFEREQDNEVGSDEQVNYYQSLPLSQYIAAKIAGKSTIVTGGHWELFASRVTDASEGQFADADWESRVTDDDKRWSNHPFSIYFWPDEQPLASIVEEPTDDTRYLIVEIGSDRSIIEWKWRSWSQDDFSFGGLLDSPPTRFLYPLRTTGMFLISIGCLTYLLLPRRSFSKDEIYFASWSLMFGDIVGALFFVAFFALPVMVSGGSIQAITHGWFLCLFLWPMALMGAWLLVVMGTYGAYRIQISQDGLAISTGQKQRFVSYNQIRDVQPLVQRFPEWLSFLMAFAAFTSRGSDGARLAGQALILEGTSSDGMRLGLKDGTALYLWISNNMGERVLKNAQRLPETLTQHGIPVRDDPKVVQAMVIPDGERADGRLQHGGLSHMFTALVVVPFAALGVLFLGWLSSDLLEQSGDLNPTEAITDTHSPQLISHPAIRWQKTFRARISPQLRDFQSEFGDMSAMENEFDCFATGLIPTRDGGMVIFGSAGPASWMDGYVLRLDVDGEKQWESFPGVDGKRNDSIDGVLETDDGDFLVWGTTPESGLAMDGRRSLICLISESGDIRWQETWGEPEQNVRIHDARQIEDQKFDLIGTAGYETHTQFVHVAVTNSGKTAELHESATIEFDQGYNLNDVAFMINQEVLLTGDVMTQTTFKDLMTLRCQQDGTKTWQTHSGGPKFESGQYIFENENGKIFSVGVRDEFDDRSFLYVGCFDANGKTRWDHALHEAKTYRVSDVSGSTNGNLLILGEEQLHEGAHSSLHVCEIDEVGEIVWEESLGLENASLSAGGIYRKSAIDVRIASTLSWGNQLSDAIRLISINR